VNGNKTKLTNKVKWTNVDTKGAHFSRQSFSCQIELFPCCLDVLASTRQYGGGGGDDDYCTNTLLMMLKKVETCQKYTTPHSVDKYIFLSNQAIRKTNAQPVNICFSTI
jgi:hypothetical protein